MMEIRKQSKKIDRLMGLVIDLKEENDHLSKVVNQQQQYIEHTEYEKRK